MRPTYCLPERSEGKTKAISNSTYRLRYAPKGARRQRSKATMKSALLLPERSEGKTKMMKQQQLPLTVCAAECETVEDQSDDEALTSLT